MRGSAIATDATAPGKSHYAVLDGLRGVAALMVVIFHMFEAYAGYDPHKQIINHGYLAVDFFFLLSGFVVAYAYDDRWGGMSLSGFALRRLVRLQPMVVMGGVIGASLFVFQMGYSIFPKSDVSAGYVLLVMLLGWLMIPLRPGGDLRGWDEIYPLNGPQWSLFYEYIANALYALGLRKLPVRGLVLLVALSAAALFRLALTGPRGDMIGGWALDMTGISTGMTRVMFPFFAGVLLMRIGWRVSARYPFALCSVLLVTALALPRFGAVQHEWINGLYEALCITILFPLIVAIGAGEKRVEGASIRVARVFGDLSFPLYITHYPLIYIYFGWVVDRKVPGWEGALVGVGLLATAVTVAWLCLKFYDEPVRRWLAARLLRRA
jgi:peptidoglycan/LPS O-acetylase OafA/YrhL